MDVSGHGSVHVQGSEDGELVGVLDLVLVVGVGLVVLLGGVQLVLVGFGGIDSDDCQGGVLVDGEVSVHVEDGPSVGVSDGDGSVDDSLGALHEVGCSQDGQCAVDGDAGSGVDVHGCVVGDRGCVGDDEVSVDVEDRADVSVELEGGSVSDPDLAGGVDVGDVLVVDGDEVVGVGLNGDVQDGVVDVQGGSVPHVEVGSVAVDRGVGECDGGSRGSTDDDVGVSADSLLSGGGSVLDAVDDDGHTLEFQGDSADVKVDSSGCAVVQSDRHSIGGILQRCDGSGRLICIGDVVFLVCERLYIDVVASLFADKVVHGCFVKSVDQSLSGDLVGGIRGFELTKDVEGDYGVGSRRITENKRSVRLEGYGGAVGHHRGRDCSCRGTRDGYGHVSNHILSECDSEHIDSCRIHAGISDIYGDSLDHEVGSCLGGVESSRESQNVVTRIGVYSEGYSVNTESSGSSNDVDGILMVVVICISVCAIEGGVNDSAHTDVTGINGSCVCFVSEEQHATGGRVGKAVRDRTVYVSII